MEIKMVWGETLTNEYGSNYGVHFMDSKPDDSTGGSWWTVEDAEAEIEAANNRHDVWSQAY